MTKVVFEIDSEVLEKLWNEPPDEKIYDLDLMSAMGLKKKKMFEMMHLVNDETGDKALSQAIAYILKLEGTDMLEKATLIFYLGISAESQRYKDEVDKNQIKDNKGYA